MISPVLVRREVGDLRFWTDPGLAATGAVIGFSERSGGTSGAPFASLNLAAHVGDDPIAVDENRSRLLAAAGLGDFGDALTVPEQVHGERIEIVDETSAGSGSRASGGRAPVPATDALVTRTRGVPLMLCFADCVPVVLAAPGCGVAVVHAGWRGALASLPGKAAVMLAREASCDPSAVVAYIGPHIGGCHYPVGEEVMSQFCNTFGTVARADSGGLDLDAAVTVSLVDAGVAPCNIARLGTCTAEAIDRFYSFRSEDGHTGRHSAFACLL
ncbi:MAG: laccase domain-containing protein [Coriobacteriia bacterium]|nr:laccase domain-containing protein [Coriobacteriia bacterium]